MQHMGKQGHFTFYPSGSSSLASSTRSTGTQGHSFSNHQPDNHLSLCHTKWVYKKGQEENPRKLVSSTDKTQTWTAFTKHCFGVEIMSPPFLANWTKEQMHLPTSYFWRPGEETSSGRQRESAESPKLKLFAS